MPRSKDATSLFEVYHRRKDEPSAPSPVEEAPAEQAAAEAPPQPADEAVSQRTELPEEPQEEEQDLGQATESGTSPDVPAPRIVAEGDGLRVHLSTLSVAMIIVGLLAVVCGAFWIGRQSGYRVGKREFLAGYEAHTAEELRQIRSQPPDPNLLKDVDLVERSVQSEQARQERDQRGGSPGWVPGLNYIWVDTFKTRSAAENAQSYLQSAGIATARVEKNGAWRLYTRQGFDYLIPEQKAACQDLEKAIRELGEAYLKAGGRYRFDCQITKLQNDHW